MEQTILTPSQSQFLELAQSNIYITKNYYLTGGTALASFYYQHRLSEDIDLFCEKHEVISDLIINSKAKFDWHIDPINLASQFSRVNDLLKTKDIPKMLVHFDQKKMIDYFLQLAKSLEKDIFK